MSNTATSESKSSRGFFDRFLNLIEKAGNLLPNPVMLFFWLCVIVVILSAYGAWMEWELTDPRPDGAKGKATDGLVAARSLLSEEGLRWIITNLVKNFVNFAPLGTVLVALMGVGLAEHSGLISAAIRLMILRAPKNLVTMVLVFAGVNSNIASEIGYVVIVPMGAAIYYSLGRHPLAGLAAAFAGVSGGYSANLLLGTVDPLLAGMTQPAARTIDAAYEVNAACNFYFLFWSTFLITLAGTWVSLRIVEPRLGPYDKKRASGKLGDEHMSELTKTEKRGLIGAGFVTLLMSAAMIYLCVTPETWSSLGNRVGRFFSASVEVVQADKDDANNDKKQTSEKPSTDQSAVPVETDKPEKKIQESSDKSAAESGFPYMGALARPAEKKEHAAFLDGVVGFVFIGFLIPGIVYGLITGSIKNDGDVIKSMSKSMSSMGSYIVLVFFAAQFVEFFNWTNLGLMLAIQGADLIRWMNLDNPLIFVFFILLSAMINMLIGSASAKWGFMAPVFVPMLMNIGYSPEITQLAYRIGDSCTNVISPMMSYFGMIYVFASNYEKDFKLGTLMSLMMPYSMVFLFVWTVAFYLWIFVFGFPIGYEVPITYPAAVN